MPHRIRKGCCGSHEENSIGFWSDANPTTTSCAEQLSSDVGVVRRQWNHIAVVVDETHHTNDVFFYINGQLRDTEGLTYSDVSTGPPTSRGLGWSSDRARVRLDV